MKLTKLADGTYQVSDIGFLENSKVNATLQVLNRQMFMGIPAIKDGRFNLKTQREVVWFAFCYGAKPIKDQLMALGEITSVVHGFFADDKSLSEDDLQAIFNSKCNPKQKSITDRPSSSSYSRWLFSGSSKKRPEDEPDDAKSVAPPSSASTSSTTPMSISSASNASMPDTEEDKATQFIRDSRLFNPETCDAWHDLFYGKVKINACDVLAGSDITSPGDVTTQDFSCDIEKYLALWITTLPAKEPPIASHLNDPTNKIENRKKIRNILEQILICFARCYTSQWKILYPSPAWSELLTKFEKLEKLLLQALANEQLWSFINDFNQNQSTGHPEVVKYTHHLYLNLAWQKGEGHKDKLENNDQWFFSRATTAAEQKAFGHVSKTHRDFKDNTNAVIEESKFRVPPATVVDFEEQLIVALAIAPSQDSIKPAEEKAKEKHLEFVRTKQLLTDTHSQSATLSPRQQQFLKTTLGEITHFLTVDENAAWKKLEHSEIKLGGDKGDINSKEFSFPATLINLALLSPNTKDLADKKTARKQKIKIIIDFMAICHQSKNKLFKGIGKDRKLLSPWKTHYKNFLDFNDALLGALHKHQELREILYEYRSDPSLAAPIQKYIDYLTLDLRWQIDPQSQDKMLSRVIDKELTSVVAYKTTFSDSTIKCLPANNIPNSPMKFQIDAWEIDIFETWLADQHPRGKFVDDRNGDAKQEPQRSKPPIKPQASATTTASASAPTPATSGTSQSTSATSNSFGEGRPKSLSYAQTLAYFTYTPERPTSPKRAQSPSRFFASGEAGTSVRASVLRIEEMTRPQSPTAARAISQSFTSSRMLTSSTVSTSKKPEVPTTTNPSDKNPEQALGSTAAAISSPANSVTNVVSAHHSIITAFKK